MDKEVVPQNPEFEVTGQPMCAVPTLYFIGVTTKQSSIMQVFPRWMEVLGRPDVAIRGIDLKLHDTDAVYRQVVEHIKRDPLAQGALVTTHKLDLLAATRDLFDSLDAYAELCSEVSCISKRDGRLVGHAKDPTSAGLTLDAMLGAAYFERTAGHVLCLGAGGAGVAIALHLAAKGDPSDRPQRLIVVDRSQPRLDDLRELLHEVAPALPVEYVLNEDPQHNDMLIGWLPDGSLVVNATGMGKDRPGSPITDAACLPRNGIVWELNYRGELQFLQQARRQVGSRGVRVEDGWLYFLHGWTSVIAEVLRLEIAGDQFAKLAEIAADLRPPLPG